MQLTRFQIESSTPEERSKFVPTTISEVLRLLVFSPSLQGEVLGRMWEVTKDYIEEKRNG